MQDLCPTLCVGMMLGWGGESSPYLGVGQQLSAELSACSLVVCSFPHTVLANRGS